MVPVAVYQDLCKFICVLDPDSSALSSTAASKIHIQRQPELLWAICRLLLSDGWRSFLGLGHQGNQHLSMNNLFQTSFWCLLLCGLCICCFGPLRSSALLEMWSPFLGFQNKHFQSIGFTAPYPWIFQVCFKSIHTADQLPPVSASNP